MKSVLKDEVSSNYLLSSTKKNKMNDQSVIYVSHTISLPHHMANLLLNICEKYLK